MTKKIIILKNCSYCNPECPSAVAVDFKEGQELSVPSDVSELLSNQLVKNEHAKVADRHTSYETKIIAPLETKIIAPDETKIDSIENLRQQAESLGINADKRWGKSRLIEEINVVKSNG